MAAPPDSVAQAIAGAGGGAVAMAITYPLITLSTRAQTEHRRQKSLDAAAAAAAATVTTDNTDPPKSPRRRRRSSTLLGAAAGIVQREGVSGLYSGLQSALLGISVTNFVYYYIYEGTRSTFTRRRRMAGSAAGMAAGSSTMSTAESILAGAAAGAVTVFATNPIWVVNTRQTVSGSHSAFAVIRDMLRHDGPKAFFAGLAPSLVLTLNPIIQYTIFERLCAVIQRRRKLRPLDFFLLGALGKLIATITTYPYITVKARMQLRQRVAGEDASTAKPPTSTFAAFRAIAQTEGWSSLYRGLDSKLLQSVLTSALLFYFKEQLLTVAVALLRVLRRRKTLA
ncbi:mitochondrial carrier domain-containing protein [Limtongia smithiae]|uniref:mitochondrial carrier domain-containing protein n=1 Tax=Limtongia smithiae TaxID=1125753 RepID=UPI0034CFB173